MPREIFFSSYLCDCGHQIDFSENTVDEVKQKSKRKRQWLIETCNDPAEEHVIIFDGGKMVDILCPEESGRHKKPKFTKKQGEYLAFITQYTNLHGVPPAEHEMQRHFGVSPPSVHQMVINLEHLNPNSANSYTSRGIAYGHKGDFESAIASFNQALKLNPNDAKAYNGRGYSFYQVKKDFKRAIADFDQALKLKPGFPEAYANRGNTYLAMGDFDHAISDLNQALKLDPGFAKAYGIRGIYYGRKGDFERAIADFNKALDLDPLLASAYVLRGNLYGDKGDHDRAIADFNQALKLKPNNATAYCSRAITWFYKMDYDRAWADVKACQNAGGTPAPNFIDALRRASGRK